MGQVGRVSRAGRAQLTYPAYKTYPRDL